MIKSFKGKRANLALQYRFFRLSKECPSLAIGASGDLSFVLVNHDVTMMFIKYKDGFELLCQDVHKCSCLVDLIT